MTKRKTKANTSTRKRCIVVEDVQETTPLNVMTPDGPRIGNVFVCPDTDGLLAVSERPDGWWSVVGTAHGAAIVHGESKLSALGLAVRTFELAVEDGIDLAGDPWLIARWVATLQQRLAAEFSKPAGKLN